MGSVVLSIHSYNYISSQHDIFKMNYCLLWLS